MTITFRAAPLFRSSTFENYLNQKSKSTNKFMESQSILLPSIITSLTTSIISSASASTSASTSTSTSTLISPSILPHEWQSYLQFDDTEKLEESRHICVNKSSLTIFQWLTSQCAWIFNTLFLNITFNSSSYGHINANTNFEKLSNHQNVTNDIPQYVLDYAPYCWLYSTEDYWPGPIEQHIENTTPYIDFEPVDEEHRYPDVNNLDELNDLANFKHIFLTSNDDVDSYPEWLSGEEHIPNEDGRSTAPVVLIVVDKGNHLDAFWFFFYSFNLGNSVFGIRFGNHVGDWEHTMIRFDKKTQKPTYVFFSAHEWGSAFHWDDCEKEDKRLYTYSAYGTHAMYRTSGSQAYVLPFGILHDTTDRGVKLDPLKNMYSYTYDAKKQNFSSSNLTPDIPLNYLYFKGKWGDKRYPLSDPRQYKLYDQFHFDTGPTGPWRKNLGRKGVCQTEDEWFCFKDDVNGIFDLPGPRTFEEWERMKKNEMD